MYIETDSTMENNILVMNQTLGSQFGIERSIPKRVPVDSIQWMESSTLGKTLLTPDELARLYGEQDFSFYLVLTLLTLGFVCGILCLYICFCAWAMKGNMDLPLPGGGVQKTSVLKFVNPLKNTSILSYIRKFYGQSGDQSAPTCTTNSEGRQQEPVCRAKEARIPAISHDQPGAETTNNLSPGTSTASYNQQDFNELAANQRRPSLGHNSSNLFESKAQDLQNSFKQFKQFRYDHQMDDEPEQVVFDAFDLKPEHY
jgi:hypothetical protein